MSTKDAYKEKLETELELVKAQLDVMKAKANNLSAGMSLAFNKELDAMEEEYALMSEKLKKLDDATESTWESIKEETQNAWDRLSENVKNIADKIKG
ncbi:MAG: hypothetical protein JXQ76_09035 [Campylobacterales bacterium]|nr:hypothetical protein [Campylobacterales bacterium]